jgi:hypothetical protein
MSSWKIIAVLAGIITLCSAGIPAAAVQPSSLVVAQVDAAAPQPDAAGPPGEAATPAPPPGEPPPLPPANTQPPPLPPPGPAPTYFIERNGQAAGPFTLDQVKQEIAERRVTPQTLVWKSGTPNWMPAEEEPLLKPLVAAVPPDVPEDAKWQRYIVGTWRVQTTMSGGLATQEVTTQYRADGSYAGMVIMQMTGLPPVTQPFSGKWKVQAVSGETFTLSLTSPNQLPQVMSLRRIDENTISNETAGYNAYRIGQ